MEEKIKKRAGFGPAQKNTTGGKYITTQIEVIRNLSEREYRARPERSQSDFKNFLEPTPAHAKWKMDQEHEESDNMLNGSCLHALVLEGQTIFEIDFKCKTKQNPKQSGTPTLSPHNAGIVSGMAAGIRRNRGAMALLESATEKEVSLFWDGMKARLDCVCPIGVLDLKSTRGADLWQFQKSMHEFGYAIQAAHYLEAAALASFPADDFYFICAENFPPFECAVYKIGHESLSVGREVLDKLKKLYFDCRETGCYPGYSEEPLEINLPAWAMKKGE